MYMVAAGTVISKNIHLHLVEYISMYISLDPDKVNGFWSKLKNSLIENNHSYLIEKGKKGTSIAKTQLDAKQADKLITRLENADYIRIGSNKMIPIPPHFAIELNNQNAGKLIELITADDHPDTINYSIELIIQFAFFELKNMTELIIPFYVDTISDSEFNIINIGNNELLIKKK